MQDLTPNLSPKPKLQIDISQAPWVRCSEGNQTFDNVLMFKRLSPLVSPTGKEELVPMETMVCTKCGKIPKFFYDKVADIPDDMKSNCTF